MTELVQQWFLNEKAFRSPKEAEFVRQFQLAANRLARFGVEANGTHVVIGLTPLVLTIEVPDLPVRAGCRRNLQIYFWPESPDRDAPMLEGVWGDEHIAEENEPPYEANHALCVVGPVAATSQWSKWAIDWCVRELQRKVVRQRIVSSGSTVAERIVIEPEMELWSSGRRKHRKEMRKTGGTHQETLRP